LTAWSAAGIAGPALVNYMREYQIGIGTPKADAYAITMYIVAGMLAIGLVCNLLVTRAYSGTTTTPEKSTDRLVSPPLAAEKPAVQFADEGGNGVAMVILVAAWTAVLLPLGWGVASTFAKAAALFR
jgi:hypothetical protein